MKHIFVINPSAGSGAGVATLKEKISALKCDYEIYETTAHRDAVRFVKEYCEKTDSPVRFYACGGDGTLKEVAEGTVGYPHASFTVCPIGSGNDFVKYFGGAESFLDLERLTDAENKKVDAIGISADGIEDTYSINVCNFGFEAYVAGTMHKVRRKPIIGGSNAYTTGIVAAIFKAMKTRGEIYADGKLINPNGAFILCTAANGGYVGGGYRCAPSSRRLRQVLPRQRIPAFSAEARPWGCPSAACGRLLSSAGAAAPSFLPWAAPCGLSSAVRRAAQP